MRFGVVVFPGTWSEVDCYTVVDEIIGQPVDYVWHKEEDLSPYDCLILPGGFSYGDYLRPGAIARFSPVMKSLTAAANQWKLVFKHKNLTEISIRKLLDLSYKKYYFRLSWIK